MSTTSWHGVLPATTTEFRPDGSVDLDFVAAHAAWLIDAGCSGIVTPGSLGEGAALRPDERSAIWRACAGAVGARAPVVASIAAASTAEAVEQAQEAARCGCRGLMVLPPYVYRGDWMEMRTHVEAVMKATPLSCMLYNNPVAYGTDFTPEQVAELAQRCPTLHAVKESSGDVRRITAIRASMGPRVAVLVGLDDLVVEGIAAGAVGWIAGLVNALPVESVRLFECALSGALEEAEALYAWFLPLLRLDTVPTFVHLIKLVQQEVGHGSERVRPPRLALTGPAREAALVVIRSALSQRPVAVG